MIYRSALVVALAVLPGCPLLEIEADVGEVCLSYPDIKVDGAGGMTAINTSFTFDDLTALDELTELDADVEFVRAQLHATSGISNFTFVDQAHVTIASGDPQSTLPSLVVYDCGSDCVSDGSTLEIPSAVQRSALDYVKTGSLIIDLDIVGQLPAEAWTADVDVCLKGRVAYSL